MRALYFDGKKLAAISRRRPARRPGEALVRVALAGICSTDLEILRGYMGFRGVPGHEFVGTVAAADDPALEGKRVTGEINVPCGSCGLCEAGLGKHCPSRGVLGIAGLDGAFADYLVLPEANLHEVPPALEDEQAVFIELLAAACEVTERVRAGGDDRVAVLGDGRLAAMCAQVLAPLTSRLTVIGIDPAKLSVLAGLGLTTLDCSADPLPRSEFDLVVECTGSPEGPGIAAELARPRGTIVLKSTFHGRGRWNPAKVVVDEIRVMGSRCGPFDRAIGLLSGGEVATAPFLTAVYSFGGWKKAFRRASRRDSFKVALRF